MSVRIAFIGDTLLGGEAQETLDCIGYRRALAGIAELTADADLVVANHEGPLTESTVPSGKLDTGRKRYWYRAHAQSAEALAEVGIRVVSLANNHVLDFGPRGLADTLAALDRAGIAHCGAGLDDSAARAPVVVEVGGLRVGFLSLMQRYEMYVREAGYAGRAKPGPARLRRSRLRQEVAALNDQADLSVVLVHWGRNYRGVTALQRRLAAELAEAGAGLIVGHHPHIPQPVEIQDVPTFFSLGNAALGTPGRFHGRRPPYGLVAVVTIQAGRPVECQLSLLDVDNQRVRFQPVPARGPGAVALLKSLCPETASLGSDGRARVPFGG